MCKDNKVYSVTLNTCNPQSTDVLKDDCVAKGGVCKDDACVCQDSTISKKCVKQASAYLFEKTEKTANCSLKVSSVSCGSKDTSCDNTKGCCKDVSVSAVCEGDRIHNVIQNSCTGKKTESYYDCYPEIDTYTGKHKTCLMAKFNSPGAGVMDQSVTPSNSASCVASSCTFVGSNIYSCLDNGKYAEFTCKASGIPGYNYWGFSGAYYDTCPDLKFDLCYDPKAMCK
jgi:hypothetical protein